MVFRGHGVWSSGVVCGLQGCGVWAQGSWWVVFRSRGTWSSGVVTFRLWSTGSVVWRTGSVTLACGIFPDQRSNPCLLHWRVDEPPGKPPQRL